MQPFQIKHSVGADTPHLLDAMAQRLKSVEHWDKYRWLSTFVHHLSALKTLRLSNPSSALLGTCLQQELPHACKPIELSKLLVGLRRLRQLFPGLDITAVTTCFLEMETSWKAQEASNVLHSLAALHRDGSIEQPDNVDWKAYGRGVQRFYTK